MVKQASIQWKRLRRYLAADPGRFAGGSAVSDPLGLLGLAAGGPEDLEDLAGGRTRRLAR